MKKLSIPELSSKLLLVLQRFHLVLIFVLGIAIFSFSKINFPKQKLEDELLAFLILTALLYIPISFLLEKNLNKIQRSFIAVIPVAITGYYSFILLNLDLQIYQYQVFILGFVFVLFSFVVPFLKKEADIPFWNFTKVNVTQTIITILFAGLLFAGLSLAIYSLDVLFKIDINNKVYQNLSVFCYVIFAPVYFLSNVPTKDEMYKQDITFDKFFRILGLYIFLPILTLYSFILYVYLLQIIIKWELPNGWVSTLVSILGIGGFLCMFILFPLRSKNENKFVNILSKYFPILLMPLLMLMSIGIFRRLGDYGLTINRCLVLILNVWFYGISIYLFVSKSKHLKWIVISFATVALFSSVGPWSVFNITKRTMVNEIDRLLNEAKLLKDGKIIDNSKFTIAVDTLTSKRLVEDIKYTVNNYGKSSFEPYFKTSIKSWDAWDIIDILGIENKDQPEKYFRAFIGNKDNVIDIAMFSKLVELENLNSRKDTLFTSKELNVLLKNQVLYVHKNSVKGVFLTIRLVDKFKMFRQLQSANNQLQSQINNYTLEDMTMNGATYKLVISSVNGNFVRNDSVVVTDFKAKLFLK